MPIRVLLVIMLPLLASGCVQLTLAWADLTPDRSPASPPLEQTDSVAAWQSARPEILSSLEDHVYGHLPNAGQSRVVEKRLVAGQWQGGRLEEWVLEVEAGYGGTLSPPSTLHMAVLMPAGTEGPVPVILMETFCQNHHTFPETDLWRPEAGGPCASGGLMGSAVSFIFGRYVSTPPAQMILDRGYAIAAFHPGEVVPDYSTGADEAIDALAIGYAGSPEERPGAIAMWAWLFSMATTALEADERIDDDAVIAWGHSRYGKAALLAGAADGRIDGVISHQSGAGGASLSREKRGETVAAITDQYPHWFADAFAGYGDDVAALPVDQHQLLALVAPRPLFLGNARRDVWSDPAGSFIAAQGADPAWEIYGSEGLNQADLKSFRPGADISFFIRPGTHGITEEDWPAFLEFLDAHFGQSD